MIEKRKHKRSHRSPKQVLSGHSRKTTAISWYIWRQLTDIHFSVGPRKYRGRNRSKGIGQVKETEDTYVKFCVL